MTLTHGVVSLNPWISKNLVLSLLSQNKRSSNTYYEHLDFYFDVRIELIITSYVNCKLDLTFWRWCSPFTQSLPHSLLWLLFCLLMMNRDSRGFCCLYIKFDIVNYFFFSLRPISWLFFLDKLYESPMVTSYCWWMYLSTWFLLNKFELMCIYILKHFFFVLFMTEAPKNNDDFELVRKTRERWQIPTSKKGGYWND